MSFCSSVKSLNISSRLSRYVLRQGETQRVLFYHQCKHIRQHEANNEIAHCRTAYKRTKVSDEWQVTHTPPSDRTPEFSRHHLRQSFVFFFSKLYQRSQYLVPLDVTGHCGCPDKMQGLHDKSGNLKTCDKVCLHC